LFVASQQHRHANRQRSGARGRWCANAACKGVKHPARRRGTGPKNGGTMRFFEGAEVCKDCERRVKNTPGARPKWHSTYGTKAKGQKKLSLWLSDAVFGAFFERFLPNTKGTTFV